MSIHPAILGKSETANMMKNIETAKAKSTSIKSASKILKAAAEVIAIQAGAPKYMAMAAKT